MQDDATGKDKRADMFLSSRMNVWIECCELESRFDARPGCSSGSTEKSWKQKWQLSGALQQSVSECSSRKSFPAVISKPNSLTLVLTKQCNVLDLL